MYSIAFNHYNFGYLIVYILFTFYFYLYYFIFNLKLPIEGAVNCYPPFKDGDAQIITIKCERYCCFLDNSS